MSILERLLSIDLNDISQEAQNMNDDELQQLVTLLSEKDDKIRYQAFLLLQSRSTSFDDVYPFWDILYEKLKSSNSYQKSIGLMLIAENAKWDKENKFENIIDEYLLHLRDDQPITIRQCIQSMHKILLYKPHLNFYIADRIIAVDILSVRETMRKVILLDILGVLAMIRKYKTNDRIESYILNVLNGRVLDKKSIKVVESMLRSS